METTENSTTTEATNREEEERQRRTVNREAHGVRNRLAAFLDAQAQGWIDDATCIRYLRGVLTLFHRECAAMRCHVEPDKPWERWSAYDYWLGFEALAGLNECLEPQDKLVFTEEWEVPDDPTSIR